MSRSTEHGLLVVRATIGGLALAKNWGQAVKSSAAWAEMPTAIRVDRSAARLGWMGRGIC
jgi:hypothetical protein